MTKAEKSLGNHQETHGMQDDITEDTPVDDVKAPSVFERAKEEFEAIIDAVHHKKDTPISHERNQVIKEDSEQDKTNSSSEKNVKTPKFIEKAKEKVEKIMSPRSHHKEAQSDEIDENTSIDKVKAPNIFVRAKEEIEAVIQTFSPKKGNKDSVSSSGK